MSDATTKKQQRDTKQKSPASNPFNISTPATTNVPPASIPSTPREDVLSPTSSSNNRGAVEDSDDDSLVIQE